MMNSLFLELIIGVFVVYELLAPNQLCDFFPLTTLLLNAFKIQVHARKFLMHIRSILLLLQIISFMEKIINNFSFPYEKYI